MTPLEGAAIIAAGVGAGAVNTIVGSGSLITFPTLLFFGFPPLVANVSNTVGLVPGSLSGVVGYRHQLPGQGSRIRRFGLASLLGGLTGAALLLALPPRTFTQVVPYLILLASALMALQPWLSARMSGRHLHGAERNPVLWLLIFATAIYGGYFGAAQSVIFIAVLAVFMPDGLQRLNALKNVLALIVNVVAAAFYLWLAPVDWRASLLIGVGAIIGGQLGAAIALRMSPSILRVAVVGVGFLVAGRLLAG